MPSSRPPRLDPLALAESRQRLRSFIEGSAERFRNTVDFGAFYAGLEDSEHGPFFRLWEALHHATGEAGAHAAFEAEALVRGLPDEEDGTGVHALRTFSEALLARVRGLGASGGNLYLGARPPGAQLRAFELLRLRTPLIPFAYAAGNRAILEVIETGGEGAGHLTDVTLLDIGIGRGGQIRALLRNPAARRLIRSIRVVGVEPDSSSATGSGALELAQENVLTTAAELGIKATFHGIPKLAEEVTASDLRAAEPRGLFLANSAFTLHHVAVAEAQGGRDAVLAAVREAGVEALVLVEPDSNHYDDDLFVRFLHAYRHYRTISRSLHAMLGPADALLVWNEFFAPEVRNVIAHDGAQRIERHEELLTWRERLRHSGWKLDSLRDVLPQSAAPPGFEVRNSGDAFTLCYRGVSVLGVLRGR